MMDMKQSISPKRAFQCLGFKRHPGINPRVVDE